MRMSEARTTRAPPPRAKLGRRPARPLPLPAPDASDTALKTLPTAALRPRMRLRPSAAGRLWGFIFIAAAYELSGCGRGARAAGGPGEKRKRAQAARRRITGTGRPGAYCRLPTPQRRTAALPRGRGEQQHCRGPRGTGRAATRLKCSGGCLPLRRQAGRGQESPACARSLRRTTLGSSPHPSSTQPSRPSAGRASSSPEGTRSGSYSGAAARAVAPPKGGAASARRSDELSMPADRRGGRQRAGQK
jgi:hypothetical protein